MSDYSKRTSMFYDDREPTVINNLTSGMIRLCDDKTPNSVAFVVPNVETRSKNGDPSCVNLSIEQYVKVSALSSELKEKIAAELNIKLI